MIITEKDIKINKIFAATTSLILTLFIILFVYFRFFNEKQNLFYLIPIFIVSYAILYIMFTIKYQRRMKIINRPFPKSWEEILINHVQYYNGLSEDEKKRFQKEIQIFLSEKRITGIKTQVDDITRILVAASAIIPVFSFTGWEYEDLGEILIYPGMFDENFKWDGDAKPHILGLAGTGQIKGIMILSKPALYKGFNINPHNYNVGIHEFAHFIDKAKGNVDGVPALLDKKLINPWIKLMYDEMDRIKKGKSDINPYALKNPGEFFAVTSEYFFESPDVMESRHPELYNFLKDIYKQDMKERFKSSLKAMFFPYGNKFNINNPCPCGNGKKFRDCCLKGNADQPT